MSAYEFIHIFTITISLFMMGFAIYAFLKSIVLQKPRNTLYCIFLITFILFAVYYLVEELTVTLLAEPFHLFCLLDRCEG